MTKKHGFRGYVFSRPILDHRVPQHIQNLVIREYASQKGLHYLLSGVEHRMDDHFLMLEQLLDELQILEGLILYSLFMLPLDIKQRSQVFDKVLKNNAIVHCAVENISISNQNDIERVNDIFLVQNLAT